MNIIANDIKPVAKGKSDFFSWQLFRWIRKNPTACRIYSGTWNSVNGVDAANRILYIGYEREGDRWISARPLRNLCCVGQDLQSYSFGPCHDIKNWVDVTNIFWGEYMKKGVCAIHGGYSHKWTQETDELRDCDYCGEIEILKTKMVEVKEWVKL
jgi:hypothetical protein